MDKEICASKTASHCGPNGSGPWAKKAAGTFTLQPGRPRRFYCSTYAVLTLFPLTNQAKASYTPRNSPANTPPSYPAWSSATACSLLCLLG